MGRKKFKRLVCSECGFMTNAMATRALKVLCAGCVKHPQVVVLKKGEFRDTMESALREYENLPEWLKIKGE